MSRIISLKTDPELFQQSWEGKRDWEIRVNDRDFKEGDILELVETRHTGEEMAKNRIDPVLTGRKMIRKIINVCDIGGSYGLENGWVILSVTGDERVSEYLPQPGDDVTVFVTPEGVSNLMFDFFLDDTPVHQVELAAPEDKGDLRQRRNLMDALHLLNGQDHRVVMSVARRNVEDVKRFFRSFYQFEFTDVESTLLKETFVKLDGRDVSFFEMMQE